ncbi:MAG TPA: AI-2E family transporter [Rhizomicrobium sp.]|jgi:predicted PurR-regulated permease PerM
MNASLPSPTPLNPRYERLATGFMSMMIAAVVVAGLYFASPILMPLALAILIAFALSPLVELLRRIRLGRVFSVLVSVLIAVVVMVCLGAFIGSQIAGVATELPRYQRNLLAKIHAIEGKAVNNTVVQSASSIFNNLGGEMSVPAQGTPPGTRAKPGSRPVPVEVVRERNAPIAVIENVIGPLLEPLAWIAIVIVFVSFILLQKDDLRDRFIRLAGYQDLQRTTVLLNDAADRLSRYLLSQTAINTCFGIIIFLGLWVIGIPNPGLWGLAAAMLRYIPYLGVPLAALFPLAIGFAIDPGWSLMGWTLALFLAVEPTIGQVIEPYVYGRNMGMSAVAVVVAAVFWTWLWGPIGLLLSTPLTMCLVVMGRHIEPLRFLDVMLGDRPPLAVEESLYLRMLAGDPDAAALEAEAFLKENSLCDYLDDVAVRALALAQRDYDRGALDSAKLIQIRNTVDALIENVSEHDETRAGSEVASRALSVAPLTEDELAAPWRSEPVLCVAGRSPLDEAAARLLAHLLGQHGIGARVVSAEEVSPTSLPQLKLGQVQVICVSYLDPGNYKHARYLVRRLKKRIPEAHPIAGFWGHARDDSHYLDTVEAMEIDDVVSSLNAAVERIAMLARRAGSPAETPTEQAAE